MTALQNGHVSPSNIIGVGSGAYLACRDGMAHVNSGNEASLYIGGADVGAAAIKVLVDYLRDNEPLQATSIANNLCRRPAVTTLHRRSLRPPAPYLLSGPIHHPSEEL